MAVVRRIDAAWTLRNASGVAVAADGAEGWRLIAAASSHAEFLGAGGPPTAGALLARAEALTGAPVDLVAVDMPLSRGPITGYREADRQVSAAYGARKAATQPPGSLRPGPVSEKLRDDFAREGYALRTTRDTAGRLAEVYPHPALIELLNAPERLPYKVSRARGYWPGVAPPERRVRLISVWRGIVAALDRRLAGAADLLPLPTAESPLAALKRFEDRLNAVVCVLAGIAILAGRVRVFGDEAAAIWVPRAGLHLSAWFSRQRQRGPGIGRGRNRRRHGTQGEQHARGGVAGVPARRWPARLLLACEVPMSRRPLLVRTALAAVLAAAVLGAPAAIAHHGWNWAEAGLVQMTATIRGVSMDPPHPTLQVEDAGGDLWTVELGNPGRTERSGFTAERAPAGASVTILGNRSLDPQERRLKAVRITIGGTDYDMYPERIPARLPPAE